MSPTPAAAGAAQPGRWERFVDAGRRHWQQLWPLLRDTGRLLGPSARLLTTIDSHTYAYSVAANTLLASAPFLFLLLWSTGTFAPHVPSQSVIQQLLNAYLPMGQGQLLRDATHLAHRHTVQALSLVMLAISSSGVFMPLEVALNSIWGFPRNRGYIGNQAVALGLVVGCGAVLFAEIVTAGWMQRGLAALLPASWTGLFHITAYAIFNLVSVPATILIFFIIYWWLPNGTVPAVQVFPAAFYTGLLAVALQPVFRHVVPLFDFHAVYATLELAVTLVVWGYCGALLLLFGASLSARGVAHLPARIRLPQFAELRAWYVSHNPHPRG